MRSAKSLAFAAVALISPRTSIKSCMADDHLFVDTWGWLVLADRQTPAFTSASEARRTYLDERRALVTTDYVLDETITRLFAATPFTTGKTLFDGILES